MDSKTSYIKDLFQKAKSDYNKSVNFLSSFDKKEDNKQLRIQLNTETFNEINCLDCGNCCKTTPAIVLESDMKKIAKFLNLSKKQFKRKYLIDDLTGDQVLNVSPCNFLNLKDNKCSIYEVRPQACRNYPHLDDTHFNHRPKWNANNTLICPAAFLFSKKLEANLNRKK